MVNHYLLTERLFKQLTSRCGILSCAKCGKPLKPNEKIVSIIVNGKKTKRYHEKCYEAMFIDA